MKILIKPRKRSADKNKHKKGIYPHGAGPVLALPRGDSGETDKPGSRTWGHWLSDGVQFTSPQAESRIRFG